MMYSYLITILCALLLSLCPTSEAKSIQGRLAGGRPATVGQFPFLAGIYATVNGSNYFQTGVLLTTQWVLTSASSIVQASSLRVLLGSNSLNAADSNRITVITNVFVVHTDYDHDTFEHDIALIKLPEPLAETAYVKPVDLVAAGYVPGNIFDLVTAGWGSNAIGGNLVDSLQYVRLVSISNEECRRVYGNPVTERIICAFGIYDEGLCDYDSGAPLIAYEEAPFVTLVAIGSFYSANGCEVGDPSGFTRVSSYLNWIESVIF